MFIDGLNNSVQSIQHILEIPRLSDYTLKQDSPKLVQLNSKVTPCVWTLAQGSGPLVIGRDHECHITLPISLISRQHCIIYRDGGSYIVEDLNSKNGTFVNGTPCRSLRVLNSGDEIQIGFGAKVRFIM